MKKYFLKYSLILLVASVFVACEDYEPERVYHDSVLLKLSDKSFTMLDATLPTTIDFVSTSRTVTDVVISVNGKEINKGTASENKYSFTLDRSNFEAKADTIDGSFRVDVLATVDGKVKEMYSKISMKSASSLVVPEEDEKTKVSGTVYAVSSLVKNFTFEVSTKTVVKSNVKLELKVAEKGTYAEVLNAAYDKDNAELPVKGTDYTVGDTVYVKMTTTVGLLSEVVEEYIIIKELSRSNSFSSIMMKVDAPGYDVLGDSIIDIANANCMFEFNSDIASMKQGILALNNTSLVLIEDAAFLKKTSLALLKTTFEAGTSLTAIEQATEGTSYILMHTRAGKDYYGILKIDKSVRTSVEADNSIALSVTLDKFDLEK